MQAAFPKHPESFSGGFVPPISRHRSHPLQNHKPYLLSCLIPLLLAAGCSSTAANSKNAQPNLPEGVISEWHDDNGKSYPIRKNTHPTERYEFNVSMPDAPDNLVMTHAFAYYRSNCEIVVNSRAGANAKLKATLPIQFENTGRHTYRAVAYGDAVLSERYGEAGPECKWELHFVLARLQPQPNESKVIYEAIIDPRNAVKVSDGHWRRTLYMTKYRFNVPYENMSESRRKIQLPGGIFDNKDRFGGEPRKHLFEVLLDLRRK